MNTTMTIPKDYSYISQVPEFKEDVPDNCYIDKGITGCGFTTAILQNNVSYVIAVPFIALTENKCEQAKYDHNYPHDIFPVNGDTDLSKLVEYLKDDTIHIKKLMVTYDSLKKLHSYIDPKDYKLFIDEAHKILEYAGNFKPVVIQYLLKSLTAYKSFVLTTATPTKLKYLPEELKNIPRITMKWTNTRPVVFNHKRLNQNQLPDAITGICLAHLREEEDGNIYIFYNSVKGIARAIKTLVKTYKYTYKDIDVICSDSPANRRTLRSLGAGWKPAKPVNFDKEGKEIKTYRKVNFVTSTAFEGVDFKDPNGKTLIVSDGKLEHTKLDISTQVSQIVGRLRESKYKDRIDLLWTFSPINEFKTLEEYEEHVEELSVESDGYISDYDGVVTTKAKQSLISGVEKDIFFIDNSDEDGLSLIKNPNAINCLLNTYEGTNMVYSVSLPENSFDNDLEDKVTHTVRDIFTGEVTSNLNIPELSAQDKKLIGKCSNYAKTAESYIKSMIRLVNDKSLEDPRNLEVKEGLETFVLSVETDSHYESLLEYIQIFGIKDLSEHSYRADKINKRLNDHKLLAELPQILKRELSLKLNSIHTKKDLKDKLQEIYDNNGISSKATAAKIKMLYLVKDAKNSDGENCFQIIKKL